MCRFRGTGCLLLLLVHLFPFWIASLDLKWFYKISSHWNKINLQLNELLHWRRYVIVLLISEPYYALSYLVSDDALLALAPVDYITDGITGNIIIVETFIWNMYKEQLYVCHKTADFTWLLNRWQGDVFSVHGKSRYYHIPLLANSYSCGLLWHCQPTYCSSH